MKKTIKGILMLALLCVSLPGLAENWKDLERWAHAPPPVDNTVYDLTVTSIVPDVRGKLEVDPGQFQGTYIRCKTTQGCADQVSQWWFAGYESAHRDWRWMQGVAVCSQDPGLPQGLQGKCVAISQATVIAATYGRSIDQNDANVVEIMLRDGLREDLAKHNQEVATSQPSEAQQHQANCRRVQQAAGLMAMVASGGGQVQVSRSANTMAQRIAQTHNGIVQYEQSLATKALMQDTSAGDGGSCPGN